MASTAEKLDALPFTATLTKRAATWKDQDEWMVNVDGFVTTYRKGTGLREGYKPKDWSRLTVYDVEQCNARSATGGYRSRHVDPTLREVLVSLAADAQSFLGCGSVDEFADEFGFKKPSEAIRAWEACGNAAKFFQARGLDVYAEELQDA